MDSRDITLLLEPLREQTRILIEQTLPARGYTFRPTTTRRTPWDQARTWRQGRDTLAILAEIAKLRANGIHALARYIEMVGPQAGSLKVTNALPGLSWHQWLEAVDLALIIDGHAVYDIDDDAHPGGKKPHPAYRVLAEEAEKAGLYPGAKFGDFPHVQIRSTEPIRLYRLDQINAAMMERYGLDEDAWRAAHPG